MNDEKSLMEISDDNLAAAIKDAEKRIGYIKRCIELSIKITTIEDWTIFDGLPYLELSGAEKIASLFGIGWENVKYEKDTKSDAAGTYYIYTYIGTFYLSKYPERKAEYTGGCSSRDKFFGIVGGEYKQIQDVNELNIKKKAWTNLLNRGIKGILGLNGLTKKQLIEAGLELEDMASVTHKTGKKGGTSKETVKKELAEKIHCVCLFLAKGDKKKAADFYHNAPGKADFDFKDSETGETKKYIAPEPKKLTQRHAYKVWENIEKECKKLNIDWGMALDEYGERKDGTS